jgi:divalent metal cation (Fe/Co/Zn/Cd) transporter
MPLRDAHLLGHQVKDAIIVALPSVIDVLVHMEPHDAP